LLIELKSKGENYLMKVNRFPFLSLIVMASALVFTSCSKKKVTDDADMIEDVSAIGAYAPGARIDGLPIVYFEFDSFNLSSASRDALNMAADWMMANPNVRVQVEGHCDERGTTEYNLALGERRASAVRDYLVMRGVPVSQLSTISYGEERPAVPGFDEASWAQNRRAEFVSAGY